MDELVGSPKKDSTLRPEASPSTHPPALELRIGSNIFRNTNGVIKIHGKEQLVVETKPDQGLLLVTIDLYSDAGTHIGHLRRNVLALNQAGQFLTEIQPVQTETPVDAPTVRLLDGQNGDTVFEASLLSGNRVRITAGKFHSHKGIPVEITPHYCRIGTGTTRFGDIVESRGGSVILG